MCIKNVNIIDHAKTAKIGDNVKILLKSEANAIIQSADFLSELAEHEVELPSDVDELLTKVIPEIVAGTKCFIIQPLVIN